MQLPERYLTISIAEQQLMLIEQGIVLRRFTVSTAKNGAGQRKGSYCTPTGWHQIRAKIGAAVPQNGVFVARRFTGEIYSPQLAEQHPYRDWILSRILWLDGLEAGHNRYGAVNTASRYIYIHGSPDMLMTGQPESHGCVRMLNADIIELFADVAANTRVWIQP